jgi:hypothetical protein
LSERGQGHWWQRRLARRAFTALAVGGILAAWLWLNLRGIFFRDALAYWGFDFTNLYGGQHVGEPSAYLYSPAFAQLLAPLGALPWQLFAAIWSGLNLGVLIWMTGPRLAAVLLLFPGSPVADEITTGNIHLLLAATVVLGFRASGWWTLPLLTKVTPGIGVLWFAGRREWRELVVALATTAVIAIFSFLIAPHAWVDWLDTLRRSSGIPVPGQIAVVPGPLALRVLGAGAIAIYAGATNRRWLAPLPVFLALPVPWSSGLAVLVAMIPLGRADARALAHNISARGRVRWREYSS